LISTVSASLFDITNFHQGFFVFRLHGWRCWASAGKEVGRETIISARDRDPTIWAVNHALKPEARHKVTLVGSCTIIIVIIVHPLAAAYAA